LNRFLLLSFVAFFLSSAADSSLTIESSRESVKPCSFLTSSVASFSFGAPVMFGASLVYLLPFTKLEVEHSANRNGGGLKIMVSNELNQMFEN